MMGAPRRRDTSKPCRRWVSRHTGPGQTRVPGVHGRKSGSLDRGWAEGRRVGGGRAREMRQPQQPRTIMWELFWPIRVPISHDGQPFDVGNLWSASPFSQTGPGADCTR